MARILIAEDSPTSVEIIRRALEPLGHELLAVADGEAAARAVATFRPDLIIADIVMPKLNGFQLCRKLRADPATSRVPIIAVTAMDRASDRYWGLKQGLSEYLFKPVDTARLVAVVGRFLPGGAGATGP